MNYFDSQRGKHVFAFSFPGPGPVFLVGDFNDWKASPEYQMHEIGKQWTLELLLPAGHYRYGFEVRGCIFEDPNSHHLRRSFGWPRSCAVCPMNNYCKTADKNSKTPIAPLSNRK